MNETRIPRKVIQIAAGFYIIALCDDGTMWKMANDWTWEQIAAVPDSVIPPLTFRKFGAGPRQADAAPAP